MSDTQSSGSSEGSTVDGRRELLDRREDDEMVEEPLDAGHASHAAGFDLLPRHHSYLPGTSHPLYPESLWQQQRTQEGSRKRKPSSSEESDTRTSHGTTRRQLAILELNGVVFFPGQTLPLRLRHPQWRTYLGESIDANRVSSEAMCLGVVTRPAPRLDRQRRSWLRTSMHGRPFPLAMLEGLEDSDNSLENDGDVGLVPEAVSDDRSDINRVDETYGATAGASGRQRRPGERAQRRSSVRRLIVNWIRSEQGSDTSNSRGRRRSIGRASTIRLADGTGSSDTISAEEDLSDSQSRRDLRQSSVTSSGSIPESTESGENDESAPGRRRPRDVPRQHRNVSAMAFPSDPDDSLIGMVGTMAVIVNRHGGDDTDVVNVGDPIGPIREQVVVTALGTNVRFRVVSRVDESDMTGDERGYGDMARVRLYWCEEFVDEDVAWPSLPLRPRVCLPSTKEKPGLARLEHHYYMCHELARVSPLPFHVYNRYWPWTLVELIRDALDQTEVFEGLRRNLPAFGENTNAASASLLEPVAFSFWMATHMSLTETDKLKLLRMLCSVERLRFIYARVLEQNRNNARVCCRTCLTELSTASSMFTVGGAEGTTGAYVNEYGIVHQTVTLRQVNEENLTYAGESETRDSWFPGYSWTIANCRQCYSHLGWKFLLVDKSPQASTKRDRPTKFWGLSGASVTSLTSSRPVDYQVEDDTT